MTEARALAELDALLGLPPDSREQRLREIACEDPWLHGRVTELLLAAEAPDSSQILGAPVAAALRVAHLHPILASGATIAGYRLVRELGRGGMAAVWLAERVDGIVKRPAALKLPMHAFTLAADVARFERERDVLAGLSHPNIARLYDAGVADGQPFIVLEYVDGQPITAHCDAHRLGLRARLALFLEVLAAVEHAHRHLVVHRDLKPSNILVDREGRVKLLDFGIARLLDHPERERFAAELTEHGASVFTPLYAAPEQVKGETISTATDIFVLGIVLHELLTGLRPHGSAERPSLAQFVAALTGGALRRASEAPMNTAAANARGFVSERKLRAALRGDLDTIVQKSLLPDPAARYASVAHVAEDVRRYLEQRPLGARPAGLGYRMRLFLRRHRAASVAALLGLTVALLAGFLAWQGFTESRRYEARSIAVRDFLFDFVSDTEPTESVGGGAGMINLLRSAEQRARREFAHQPEFRGELLGELGRLYGRHGDDERRLVLLEEALTLLEAHVADGDPALNITRAHLADALRDVDQGTRARALAERARDSCKGPSSDCAKARAYAFTILGTLRSRAGESAAALASMRDAASETERGFGRDHAETALAWQRLATMYRNAGQILQASEAIRHAHAIASVTTLRLADRAGLLRTMAVVEFDMGAYEAARHRLEGLLNTTSAPRERAVQSRMLANSLIALGDPPLASTVASNALKAAQEAGSAIEEALALQAHARSISLLGQWDAAQAEHARVVGMLLEEGYAEESLDVLRARRYSAETSLRRGTIDEAAALLETLVSRYHALPSTPEIELAHALDLLGCARREQRRRGEAVALHGRASKLLQKNLPAHHPFLIRNSLYAELAGGTHERFAQLIRRGEVFLAPESIWRRLAEAELDAGECVRTGLPRCVMVL